LSYCIITLPAAVVEKYCNEHVCVYLCLSVCLSIRKHISGTTRAIFIAVARSSSDGVMQSQVEGAILGVFFPIENAVYGPYSGMNFTRKDQFGLNLLLYHKVRHNSVSCY